MKNNEVIASFGWNHEGLGHISRLIETKSKILNKIGGQPLFFVQHEQELITDYNFSQIIIPSYHESLIGDEWWFGKTLGIEKSLAKEITEGIIKKALDKKKGIIMYDVVVHSELYKWGIKNNWPQYYIFRPRKDIEDPLKWVEENAPHIRKIFWVGKPGFYQKRNGIETIGVGNIVRKRVDNQSVWLNEKTEDMNILITAGGGGHKDAKEFLQTSVNSVLKASKDIAKNINLKVILGPFFRQQLTIENINKNINLEIMPYLPPDKSPYRDTSLLICQGGYNSFNEALEEKVPVIVVPAKRELDDQKKRTNVKNLEGQPYYVSDGSIEDICKKVVNFSSKEYNIKSRDLEKQEIASVRIAELISRDIKELSEMEEM